MKNLLKLTTLLCILLQTACAGAPTIPTGTSANNASTSSASGNGTATDTTSANSGTSATNGSEAKAETKVKSNPKDFKRIDYVELPQYQQKLNNVLLDYEHSHRITNISSSLKHELAVSPVVAKYLIDHNLIRQDPNYADYLSQIALRTLIQSGQINPYLDMYWKHVLYQSDVDWFDVSFAAQASAWAAVNQNHASSQKNLAIYSMRACLTYDLAKTHSIVVPKEPDDIVSILLKSKCQEYPAEAAKWAGQYLANEQASPNDKINLLSKMADYYFDAKDYAHAASYYKLQLDLAKQNGVDTQEWKSFADAISLKQQMGSGTSIDFYLQSLARQQQHHGEKAYQRLTLIKGAGVLKFGDYGL